MTNSRGQKSARERIMDFLAKRNHSERELVKKLLKHHTNDEIFEAITEAKEGGWLLPPAEIAERFQAELDRKGKGHHKIQYHLRSRGLPGTRVDRERELEKARAIVQSKGAGADLAKRARLLQNRGFDSETIRTVIYEQQNDER